MGRAPSTALAMGAALAAVLIVGGCTTKPQVEFTPSSARPTVTVTVTVTATGTMSGTTSGTTGTTGTTTGPPSGVTVPVSPTATTTTPFARVLAEQNYANLVTDIGILDGQLSSGASPSLRLEVLRQHFATLAGLGVPPGLDGPSYLSRVRTLEMFAAAAAEESLTDRARAAARYQVVRRETALLLSQVNGVLKTAYTLPIAPPSPTSSVRATTPSLLS